MACVCVLVAQSCPTLCNPTDLIQVFVAKWAFQLQAAAALQLWYMFFSLLWLLLLQIIGYRHAGFSSCGTWAQQLQLLGLQSTDSVVVVPGFSCSAACGLFPDQGSNPALAGGFFTAESQGKPLPYVFSYKSYSLSSLCLDFLRIFKMFLAVFYHPV